MARSKTASSKFKTSFFIMNRRGTFKPAATTNNQCAKPGHDEYFYLIKLVFDGDQPLDYRQFILDHAEVDAFINKLGLVGSCEEMHVLLKHELPDFMAEKSLGFAAYKASIRPVRVPDVAWLDYVWARSEKDMQCLSYL